MGQLNENKFRNLIDKYLNNDIGDNDKKELFDIYENLQNLDQNWNDDVLGNKTEVGSNLLNRINKTLENQNQKSFTLIKIAASILICLGIGFSVYTANKKSTSPVADHVSLKLSDGEIIFLDKIKVGEEINGNGYSIKKDSSNYISFIPNGLAKENSTLPTNELILPKASSYKMKFVDGTVVTLNTASSLKFPSHFSVNSRVVYLTGEAYFNVSKDTKRDFKVVCKNQTTQVLGTHFNIKAFDNEPTITTLVEGKVKLLFTDRAKKNASYYLKPNQQSILSKNGMTVKEIDTSIALAWLSGYFEFHNDNIKTIIKELQKYYDFEVVYRGNVDKINISGRISRSKSLIEVVEILNMTDNVNISLEGRRIIVRE